MTTGPGRDDADREVWATLAGAVPVPPNEEVLAAVHDGLVQVPTGSPSAWFEVPRQRATAASPAIDRRRPS